MIDPQRDVIDDRKRSKPLGQATQFNGRQSHHSLSAFCVYSSRKIARAVVGRFIYRWINISTNAGRPERLGALDFVWIDAGI
jgi:hypothetical protein